MDWGIVIPTGITAVVGLAGIGGTLLSARMTGRSEDKRAKIAEKRRIYANCLTALNAQYRANMQAVYTCKLISPEHHAALFASSSDVSTAAVNAVFEVQLIAPFDVAEQAAATLEALLKITSESKNGTWALPLALLIAAMRADLGEPMSASGMHAMSNLAIEVIATQG